MKIINHIKNVGPKDGDGGGGYRVYLLGPRDSSGGGQLLGCFLVLMILPVVPG